MKPAATALLLAALSGPSLAQTTLQIDLENRASFMSQNGRFVAGRGVEGRAAIWSLGLGWVELGGPLGGTYVSNSGTVLVAGVPQTEGYIWEPGSGWRRIGTMGGGPAALSSDGSTVAMHISTLPSRDYLWDRSTGLETLLDLPANASASTLRALSADGRVAVGRTSGAGALRIATVWDIDQDRVIQLDVPAPGVSSEAWGVSANGEWVVGERNDNGISQAFRWSAATGLQLLPTILAPQLDFDYEARFVSNDGDTVFVRRWDRQAFDFGTVVWTSAGGTSFFTDWIQAQGGADPGAYKETFTAAEGNERFLLTPGPFVSQVYYETDAAISTSYCGPAVANSTGRSARLFVLGSRIVEENAVFLRGVDLPPGQAVLPITSLDAGSTPMVGGTAGTLCLGGDIGRFPIQASDGGGLFETRADPRALPTSTGVAYALFGETWRFQLWFRDPAGGGANLTDGASVTFK